MYQKAHAMSDRICIASKGKVKYKVSVEDLLSCCGLKCGFGCNGGYPDEAWEYYKCNGIVTGGNYNSSEGCRPYTISPCNSGLELELLKINKSTTN